MKDSQLVLSFECRVVKYIKANNERFSTADAAFHQTL